MILYDALAYLQDAGRGDQWVSVYEKHGAGIMISVNEALEENSRLARRLSEWFDRDIIAEPRLDGAERIVFCVGWPNGDEPDPEWDGYFDLDDLDYIYDDDEYFDADFGDI